MSDTTYFRLPLVGDGSQDWVSQLNQTLSKLTEVIVRTQLPSGTTLRWGDVAGGKYLEVSADGGVLVIGGLNHGSTPGSNFRVPQGASLPDTYGPGTLFLNMGDGTLKYRNAANNAWVTLGAADEAAIVAAGALLVGDLGAAKGTIPVSDGAGDVQHVVPGANNTILTPASATASGWTFKTVLALLGLALTKGHLAVGVDGAAAAASLAPGADGTILTALSSESSGLIYKTLSSLLGAILTAKGQLLSGGGGSVTVVAAPAADGYVPVSKAAEASGVLWTNPALLGLAPGADAEVAADLYLHANFT